MLFPTTLLALLLPLVLSQSTSSLRPTSPSTPTSSASIDPSTQGNCLTGTYGFNATRMYPIPRDRLKPGEHYPPSLPEVDWAGYDWTIDYTPENTLVSTADNSLYINVTKIPGGGQGSRVSMTRHVLYGRFTMRIKAIGVKGMVTSFITMSDRGDEIDWEILNTNPSTPATTNIFYKRILQFGVRNQEHAIPNGGKTDDWHTYVIDWTSDAIKWYIDGTLIRTYTKSESVSTQAGEGQGEQFFPSTPSLIQIAAWDGGDSPQQGVSAWAGGPVPWGDRTSFEAQYGPLEIQCYDDTNKPVPMWPVAGNRGRSEPPPKPTTTVAPAAAATGGPQNPGGNGAAAPLITVDYKPLITLTSGPKGGAAPAVVSNGAGGGAAAAAGASQKAALGLNNGASRMGWFSGVVGGALGVVAAALLL
ncbi:hypothetical protein HDU96_004912 [Phlyctochytrium bullatum]|nr:hypothetical protein HDU96_004912 [Phlyctochytrium bullatum]